MKKLYNLSITVAMTLLLMVVSVVAQAQSGAVIRGRVVDETGEGVIGATLAEKGTSNGTTSGLNGAFSLNVTSPRAEVTVSFLGYKTLTTFASEMNGEVVLESDSEYLDDVVIIGYGTVKKSDLSGSVVAISADDAKIGNMTSAQEMMQGRVAGLSITSGDGAPGSGSTIRIRSGASLNASNDPLIVVDGVPLSNDAAPGMSNGLASINPNDIETMTVLKDASATAITIYSIAIQ